MKNIFLIGTILMLCFPFMLKAQDTLSNNLIDSIESEFIQLIKGVDFYYRNGNATYAGSSKNLVDKPYYAQLKQPTDVSIIEATVNLTFKNKKREFHLLHDQIKKNNDYLIYFVPPIGQGYSKSGYLWGDLYFENYRLFDLQQQYIYQIKLEQIKKQKDYYDTELKKFQFYVEENKSNEKIVPITEEQRKYIVQANALTEEKKYREAYNYFGKVIEIDAVSYPQAYFNMALLASQFNDFMLAIFNMKKYLILLPDAPDARASQDKIYEWELKIGK